VIHLRNTCAIVVPLKEVQKAIKVMRKLMLVDNTLELARVDQAVLIPLIVEPSDKIVHEIRIILADAKITQASFEERQRRPRNLADCLRGKIPENLLSNLPRSFDVVGDIAIIELPPDLTEFSLLIGDGVMRMDPHVRLVLRKSGEVAGTFRTRKLELMAGTGGTETVHKEFSCLFQLDVAKAYFNPRLSHERIRIATQVKEGEHVFDMFAGVGPYSILIAKTEATSKVYSVDINPDAFRYLKQNTLLNRVADRVIPILGDAGQLAAGGLRGTANRVIMNLPSMSDRFLGAAVQALVEDGGVIHYYKFASRSENIQDIRRGVKSIVESQGRFVNSFQFSDIIKEVAPNRVQVAIDIVVE
jgi:tRNA (guanine37-N1)-methyltransferase